VLSASQRVAEDLARARISNNSAEKDRFGKRRSDLYPSAENASVREFRSILRQVRKLKDWMVERSEFELPVPVSKLSDDSVVL